MPFTKQVSKEFTRQAILALDPDRSGIYGLFRKDAWVYIGQGNLRERLLDHLDGDNPCILSQNPTHWVEEIVHGNPMAKEKELTFECQPICNK